ncbi:DUF3857 domain-containing transglutaminase family protein [Verrucomicrobiota bacterium sgz303538]
MTEGFNNARRHRTFLGWFLCSIVALHLTVSAQTPSIERIPAPEWVEQRLVEPQASPAQGEVSDGTYWLLRDEQVHAGENTRYFHSARKFVSESGVQEASRVTLTFDPAYESIALHKLIVHRDGKTFDRLQNQEIKLLQREQGLDRHSYDGRLSAVMLLEDIRVGDTIEYAYSVRGANPIFDGRFYDSFSLRWGVPLHKFSYRLLWPKGRTLALKSLGEAFDPEITTNDAFTIYTWTKSDLPPLIADGDLPSWFDPYGWFQMSEFQSWKDVAQWATRLYMVADSVPDELRQQIDAISRVENKKAQAVAALRYVQNNIRYLGMEIGVHGYKPYPLETVLKRRFGDCKDKALVLCAMLRQLGMEAYPALVETDYCHKIAEWLPSPFAFDHLVVNLRLDGRNYWLDPTMSSQGGSLDQLYFPNYGKALVISGETTALTDITPGGCQATEIDVTSEYEPGHFAGEMGLKIHTIFRGSEADRMRSWLAETSRGEIEKSYLNYYAQQYGEIRALSSPGFQDDLEKNEITADESYLISNFWEPRGGDGEKLYGDVSPQTLSDRIVQPRTHVRSMPLRLSHPRKVTETVRISIPRASSLKEESVTMKDPAFTFSKSVRTQGTNRATMTYRYETAADHVEASRTAEYLAKIREVKDHLDYTIWIPKKMLQGIAQQVADGSLSPGSFGSKPDAGNLSSTVSGFMLAPFFVVGGIGVVWVVRRYRPSKGNQYKGESVHCCFSCGATEHTSPELEFRVASNGQEYCRPHLPK